VDTIWSPRAWKKFLNPAEWFQGTMSAMEAAIMIVETILMLVVMKFGSCCWSFCCACKAVNKMFSCGGCGEEEEVVVVTMQASRKDIVSGVV